MGWIEIWNKYMQEIQFMSKIMQMGRIKEYLQKEDNLNPKSGEGWRGIDVLFV